MCVCVWPAACGRLARHVGAALVLVRSCVRVASGVSSESVRVVAGEVHAHDEGRVDPHHWRRSRERHRVGHVERRAQEHAGGGWRGALLAMPCVVVVCGVHIVGVAWFRVLVLGVCLCARPIVRVRCGVDVAACVLACVRLWERGRCVVLCIVGIACGSCWVACVGRRCVSSIARVW